MTPNQIKTFWRLWAGACRAQGWRSDKKDGNVDTSNTHGAWGREVLDAAFSQDPADPNLTLHHLRHGLYWCAARVTSQKEIGSKDDCSAVFAWLQLLIDDANLEAAGRLANREEDTRRRTIWSIAQLKCPLAYLNTIARQKFGNRYTEPRWQALPLGDLIDLCRTLKERLKSKPVCNLQTKEI